VFLTLLNVLYMIQFATSGFTNEDRSSFARVLWFLKSESCQLKVPVQMLCNI